MIDSYDLIRSFLNIAEELEDDAYLTNGNSNFEEVEYAQGLRHAANLIRNHVHNKLMLINEDIND